MFGSVGREGYSIRLHQLGD